MFTAMRRRLPLAVLTSFILMAMSAVASANHSWGGYHWARTSSPFTLKLGDNVSSAWDAYLGTASSDWSLSAVLDTSIVAGQTNPKNCRASSGRVEVCNSSYGNNGWLGIAQIWISGSHITQGVVKLNDTYFKTATYNSPAWRRLVMCQEVAHTLGLDHQDTTFGNQNLGTCMDYTNDPDGTLYNQLSNEHPNQHDYDELDIIYSHLDTMTTVGQTILPAQMPPAMNLIDFDTPAQWGKSIRSSNLGRTEVFELDFGGGHKVFTFVIWVEEGRGRQ